MSNRDQSKLISANPAGENAAGSPAGDRVSVSRTVRFSIALGPANSDACAAESRDSYRRNSFASLPSMTGLGLYCEMTVRVAGVPDARTGYLLNISAIDAAVRQQVVGLVAQRVQERATASAEALLKESLHALIPALGESVRSLRWNLTPYYSLTMHIATPHSVMMTQSFEFAAAHRLHCPDMDDDANRRVFGKCNNPSGHGHNYRLEVSVVAPLNERGESSFTLQRLEQVVDDVVIRRFDHKHLNRDTSEFASINPSVENIARVCHRLLAGPVATAGARLASVTVWETEKTSSTYPARE